MDFREELAKYGYNKGNSIDVEILIDEILPNLFDKFKQKNHIVSIMKSDEELGLYNDYGPSTFIKSDNIDGQWLSPIPSERIKQEENLVEIFGHYPNASPKWQYMNGLIQNSLELIKNYNIENNNNKQIEYFAGLAMQAIIAGGRIKLLNDAKSVSEYAVKQAISLSEEIKKI